MSTPATPLSLPPADLELELRKQRAESFIQRARRGLEAMRTALESGGGPDALEAVIQRDVVLAAIVEFDALLCEDTATKTKCITLQEPISNRLSRFFRFKTGPKPLSAPAHTAWTDHETLQRFRRAALRDLEQLERELAKRSGCGWRSGADEHRERAVRLACLRWGAGLGLAAVLLAGWWGWQRSRQDTAQARLNRAKAEAATQAVKLISMAAWLAQKTQGKPLAAIAPDMSRTCAGIDVQKTLPNHPCREAWVTGRHAIFRAAIPEPGKPVDAPSEIFSDPWGAPYVLFIPETGPAHIVSAGPDGFAGTADDVTADIPYWGR